MNRFVRIIRWIFAIPVISWFFLFFNQLGDNIILHFMNHDNWTILIGFTITLCIYNAFVVFVSIRLIYLIFPKTNKAKKVVMLITCIYFTIFSIVVSDIGNQMESIMYNSVFAHDFEFITSVIAVWWTYRKIYPRQKKIKTEIPA